MLRNWGRATAAGCLALIWAAAPAHAEFSACESGVAATSPQQKIQLYTICLTKGGVSRSDASGAFNNRGVAYEELGETDKAFADYSSAIEYNPNWGLSYLNRAKIYVARRQWPQALADIDASLKREPGSEWPDALALRAEIHLVQGDHAAADADVEEALKRGGHKPEVYDQVARALVASPGALPEESARALQLAQEAVRRKDVARFHDTLAVAYARSGDFAKAAWEEQRAIELAPRTGALDAGASRRLAVFQTRAAGAQAAPPVSPAP